MKKQLVFSRAAEVFGSQIAAQIWMNRKIENLEFLSPTEFIAGEGDHHLVLRLLEIINNNNEPLELIKNSV